MFACLFIPDFSVAALIRWDPTLQGCAVAVLAGHPPLERAVALNDTARELGVEIGATKAHLEAWQELILRSRSEAQEASMHAALLDCAQSFSPDVEDTAPGTALLNLNGLEPLFGPPEAIARNLAQRAAQMELEANVAIASNPDAALLAAHGFPGVTLIPEGREAERLGELPVDVLLESFSSDTGEAARWLEIFDRWGIRNLRALAGLPEIPLTERLGQAGLRLQKFARGAANRHLRVYESAAVFEEEIELEYPIVLLEPLAFLLNRMLEQVCARLGVRARAAQELRLELELARSAEGCDPAQAAVFTRTLRLPVPMLNPTVLLKLLQLDLQAYPPGAPISKIRLTAEPAPPRSPQNGLFLPVFPEPEKLELTLARIRGIVGEDRAGSAELLDSHREGTFEMRAFVPVPLKDKKPERKIVTAQFESGIGARESLQGSAQDKMAAVIALRLFRPALRAVVNVREGKPIQLQCPDRTEVSGDIIWTAGPWRSSGDWAGQEGWSREEWDIAMFLENGVILYRLVEDRLTRQWWVEGMYD